MNNIKMSILLALMFILGSAQGQTEDRFSLGPRAGVLFPTIVGEDVTDSEVNTGYTFGLTTTYSIMQHTGITVDFLFTQEGAKTGGNELKLNYLRLPIYFNYFFNELGEVFRPKIYAGIVPGIMTQAEINDAEVVENFNTFDLGIGGGIGFNYQVAERTWLNVDVRYVRGLTNINEATNFTGNVFNQYFQGSVGIAFGM